MVKFKGLQIKPINKLSCINFHERNHGFDTIPIGCVRSEQYSRFYNVTSVGFLPEELNRWESFRTFDSVRKKFDS